MLGYLLHGLDKSEYNALITSVNENPGTTLDDFYEQLCSDDMHNGAKKTENLCPLQILLAVASSVFSIQVAARHHLMVTLPLLMAAALIVVPIAEVEVVDIVTKMMTVDIGVVMSAVVIAVMIVMTDAEMMVGVIAIVAHMVVGIVLIALLLHM
jgi:hypothetical protein